jgi:hypothetical protein
MRKVWKRVVECGDAGQQIKVKSLCGQCVRQVASGDDGFTGNRIW